MSSVPKALIFSRNALEAEDLAEMLDSFFGMTSAVCRSADAAMDIVQTHAATLEVAFVTASLQALDQTGLLERLQAARSKIVIIDGEPTEARAAGLNCILRPFVAEDVRAALSD